MPVGVSVERRWFTRCRHVWLGVPATERVAEARTDSDMSQARLPCVGSNLTAAGVSGQNALASVADDSSCLKVPIARCSGCILVPSASHCCCFPFVFLFSVHLTVPSLRNLWPVQLRALVAYTPLPRAIVVIPSHSFEPRPSHSNNVFLEIIHRIRPAWARRRYHAHGKLDRSRSFRDHLRIRSSSLLIDGSHGRTGCHARNSSRWTQRLACLLPREHQGERRRSRPVPVPPQGQSRMTASRYLSDS